MVTMLALLAFYWHAAMRGRRPRLQPANMTYLMQCVQRALVVVTGPSELEVLGRSLVVLEGGVVLGVAEVIAAANRQPSFQDAVAEVWQTLRRPDHIATIARDPGQDAALGDLVIFAALAPSVRANYRREKGLAWTSLLDALHDAWLPWLAARVGVYVRDVCSALYGTSVPPPSSTQLQNGFRRGLGSGGESVHEVRRCGCLEHLS